MDRASSASVNEPSCAMYCTAVDDVPAKNPSTVQPVRVGIVTRSIGVVRAWSEQKRFPAPSYQMYDVAGVAPDALNVIR